ncbi:MAG: hypothetical protein ACI8X5_003030 [Planctomycetota bacterium]|jgi:hypothetical protein
MNLKSIALLLGLVAAIAIALVFFGSGDDLALRNAKSEGLTPSVETSALLPNSPRDTELATPVVADREEDGRKEVARKATKGEKRAKKKAEETARKEAGPALSGTVIGSDGSPIRSAEIKVEGNLGKVGSLFGNALKLTEETTSDQQGRFTVPRGIWPIKELSVELRARGFLVGRELRTPENDSGDSSLGEFTLDRGVVLGGQVVDSSGEPIEGATIWRTSLDDDGAMDGITKFTRQFGGANSSTAKSKADGSFELLYEESGGYMLVAEHDSYPKTRQRGDAPLLGGEDLSIILRMAPTASISGRLVGYPTGRKGVTIRAALLDPQKDGQAALSGVFDSMGFDDAQTAKVMPSGEFKIEGLLVARKYAIRATIQNGFMARTNCSETKEVSSGAASLDIELEWEAGASLTFEVQEEGTNKALIGVTARHRWQDSKSGVFASAAQKAEFDGSHVYIDELRPSPSPGSLEISVLVEGYSQYRQRDILVAEDQKVDLGVVYLQKAPILRVQVTDSDSGKPLKRVRVLLRPQSSDDEGAMMLMNGEHATARTDSDGWCELPACSTELGTLFVKKGGYAAFERKDVLMPTGGLSEEFVRLFDGGKIEVLVVTNHNEPAPKIRVDHVRPDNSKERHETSSKGIVRLTDLEAGEHKFAASRSGSNNRRGGRGGQFSANGGEQTDTRDWHSVLISNGGEGSVKIELAPTATIEGVVMRNGLPFGQASVMLLEGEEGSAADELSARVKERMSKLMPNQRDSSTRTDASGHFQLEDAPLGKHRIRVARTDGSPSHITAVNLREGINRIEIDLPSAAVEGRVVDSEGNPVEGANVEALPMASGDDAQALAKAEMSMSLFGGNITTGVLTRYDGSFRIDGVPTDRPLMVRVRAAGFSRMNSEEFTVKERDTQHGIEIVLAASGSVLIRDDNGGAMFSSVRLEFEGEGENLPGPKMAFLQNGKAIVRELEPGTWRVFLSTDKESFELVEIRQGEQSEVSLTD